MSSTKSGTTLPKVEIAHIGAPGPVRDAKFSVDSGVNLKPYIDEGSAVDSNGSGASTRASE